MNAQERYRVLLVGNWKAPSSTAEAVAQHLRARGHEVVGCGDPDSIRFVTATWWPDLVVAVPPDESARRDLLRDIRRALPEMPFVVLTSTDGPDLLRDVEAFAPLVPTRPPRSHWTFQRLEQAMMEARAA